MTERRTGGQWNHVVKMKFDCVKRIEGEVGIMRYLKICIYVLLAVLFCRPSLAGTISIIDQDHPVVIPYGKSRQFGFGTVPQANTTVLLKIKSRMDLKSLLGSLHFLRLTLNGHEIAPTKGRFLSRLVNKPLSSPVTPDLTVPWYDAGSWNVLYAPDFKAAYSQKYYVDDPYLYVFDVTDLTNPVADNRLEITNTASESFVTSHNFFNNKLDMVIGSLEIETRQGASPMMAAAESTLPPVVNHGEPAAGPAKYRGTLFDNGGFSLEINKQSYNFSSAFSYPDAGFNQLGSRSDNSGQKGWKVAKKGNAIIAQSPGYTILRTVNFGSRCVEISDAITNRHKDTQFGLSVRNEMDITHLSGEEIRLAGNPDPALDIYHSYGNPSVYVRTGKIGIGMIAEDAVFRNQDLLYTHVDEKTKQYIAGIRTDMLRLAPGETYTLKWAVYPVAGPDFYDFMNLVRQDWGANYTAQGTWLWGMHALAVLSPDEIKATIKRQGISTVIANDWVEWQPNANGTQRIGYGTDVFSDYWKDRRQQIRDDAEKIRQAAPGIKILAYYNTMRESADDTLQRFPDSLQINSGNKPTATIWTSTGAKNTTYLMVPTLQNNFGKAMQDVARRYMDDLGMDGLYWDEMEGTAFNEILNTYTNNFDGHSCLLDPKTWKIKQQVGIIPLSSKDFEDKIVELVQSKNGILLGNGPTGRKSTLRYHVQRMTEIQHNDYYAYEGLLQTPLGYISWADGWKDYLDAFKSAMIPAMGFSQKLPVIAGHLFPFTPIELHSGYLLGKERIIATHSGNFGWSRQRQLAAVYRFDENGKISNGEDVTRIGGEARTAVSLKPREAVLLERVPLQLIPGKEDKNWNAEVSEVSYDENSISLKVSAPVGGELVLQTGEFEIKNGRPCLVQLGTGKTESYKSTNNTIRVNIPAGFDGTIRISKSR